MLRLERVSKFYSAGGLVSTGFSKVDLSFDIGEFVAITGESGSGKSTLLNVISGLDSYEEGEMYVGGRPTSGFSKEDLEDYRKKYIGSIFQTFNLINSYTVYQNVELVLLTSGYSREEIPARVMDIIDQVGLSAYAKTKASKLSGGQKQRVAIARALAKETPIIVADEPTGNLDSQSAADVIRLLAELSKDKLIIIVTHNYDQVEPYVTRKITMHDGRVVEDKTIARPDSLCSEKEVETARADSLQAGGVLRLGLRNTFNLPAKFLLLLAVFIFLCGGVIAQYTSFMNMSDMQTGGYNMYFNNTERSRIIVTRPDRQPLTESDYETLEALEGVQQVVRNDLMLDLMVTLTDDLENGSFYIVGSVKEGMPDAGRIEEGRLPEKDNEVFLTIPRSGYANSVMDMAMDSRVDMLDQNTDEALLKGKIRIVGWGFMTEAEEKALSESDVYCEAWLSFPDSAADVIRSAVLELYCSQEIGFAGKIVSSGVVLIPSKEVPPGQVYVPEDLASVASGSAVGQSLELTNQSLYFTDRYSYTVGAVYNKENLQQLVSRSDFDAVTGAVFLNEDDYEKVFDKRSYQSSVMAEDYRNVRETAAAVEKAGFKAFCMEDGIADSTGGFIVILHTLYAVMLAGILLVLFFITYFIVKLILKSRNTYFSTIRMLGATKGNCSSLLKVELFAVFNIAFFFCMAILALVKTGVIHSDYLRNLAGFLSIGDLVLLYAVLCLMSILLAARYARQLFKKTAMNAYKEEV